MRGQSDQRQPSDKDRVPIQNTGLRAEFEVGPERLKEISTGIERDSANHIAERCSEEHGQQDTRDAEHNVEEILPDLVFNMGAKLYSNAAQNEQPQDNHQRQIKSAEARRVKLREGEVKSATGGD